MKKSIIAVAGICLLAGCGTLKTGEKSDVKKPAIPETSTIPKVEPVFGPTNPTDAKKAKDPVKRYASVIELNPAMEKKYRTLHANVWKEVRKAIKKAHIQNYNIFVVDLGGKRYLFSYLEYTGKNPAKDFASIGKDTVTREKWWPITDGCQIRVPGTPEGEQWKGMEMLMHIK